MKILSITAGAANMYCGSCLRDNALAAELLRRGHDVTLMPFYTPTLTDEVNVSSGNQVLFGGISVYLAQHVPLSANTPRLLDRLWDAAPVIKALAGRSMKTDPRMLGEMTVSMLKGEHGHQKKEFDKLVEWLKDEPPPDIVNLPNSLLIAMAGPIRRTLKRPVVVTMQGEDLFLDGLPGAVSHAVARPDPASDGRCGPVHRRQRVLRRADARVPRHPARQDRRRAPGNQHGRLRRPAARGPRASSASATSLASRPRRACSSWPRRTG